jgi:tetratricopeptide (TPR) repeat protein
LKPFASSPVPTLLACDLFGQAVSGQGALGRRSIAAGRKESKNVDMKTPSLVRLALLALAALVFAGCSAEAKKTRALERAGKYFTEVEYEKALIEYQNVLQLDPQNVTATDRIALIWLERGSPLRAAPYLFKMKTLAPGNLELRCKLARLLLSLGKVADARKEALEILARSSSFPEALVILTESVRNPNDLKAVEPEVQKAGDKTTVQYHLATANLLLLRGNPTEARAALQRAVSADPKSGDARLALASLHGAQNNTAQALADFKAAAELSPVRSLARVKYAAALAQTGKVPESTAYFADIARQAPDYMPAWRGQAELALHQKKYDEAHRHLRTLFTKDPADPEGRILRARLWVAEGDSKRAIQELEQFGKDFPGLNIEKHLLGLAYLQNNDTSKAITALQAAISHDRDNTEALLLWARLNLRAGNAEPVAAVMAEYVSYRNNVQAFLLLIDAMRSLGRLEAVAKAMTERLKVTPQDAQLHYLLGIVHNQQAKPAEARKSFEKSLEIGPDMLPVIAEVFTLDVNEGKWESAMKRAESLAAKMPNAAMPHFFKARVHLAKADWDAAETELLKTLDRDPRYPGVHGTLAETFLRRSSKTDTVARLEKFLSTRQNDELAALLAAQVYTKLGDVEKARSVYENFLAAKPDAALVLNNLANLYDEQLSQPDRALEMARKARNLQPGAPAIADTLGWILYKRKEYQEAFPLLQESAAKLADNPEIQFHLGMASRMVGKNEEAVAAFRVAANSPINFPAKEEAKRQLAQLEPAAPTPPTPPVATPEVKLNMK